MNTPSTRRPATAADLYVGALVYKGNGSTLYRVTVVGTWAGVVKAGVVKATTAKDTTRVSVYRAETYTVEA